VVTTFVVLAALQAVVSWITSRSRGARQAVTSGATALVRDGSLLEDAMRRQRVATEEVRAAVRGAGYADLVDVRLVVLETDGSMSVIGRSSAGTWAIDDVDGALPQASERRPGRRAGA
jgi:uncharacterized membrane protein YcaP (DUF421 family)